jgi:hypothetical protein
VPCGSDRGPRSRSDDEAISPSSMTPPGAWHRWPMASEPTRKHMQADSAPSMILACGMGWGVATGRLLIASAFWSTGGRWRRATRPHRKEGSATRRMTLRATVMLSNGGFRAIQAAFAGVRDRDLTTILTTIGACSAPSASVRCRSVCRLACADELRRTRTNPRPTAGGQGVVGWRRSPLVAQFIQGGKPPQHALTSAVVPRR